MKRLLFLLIGRQPVFVPVAASGRKPVGGYHVSKTFHIASSGGWDYIAVGPGNNRLYVSHGTAGEHTGSKDRRFGGGHPPIPPGCMALHLMRPWARGYTSNGAVMNNVNGFSI